MRFTIFTAGSRGDVQPYLALGVGLQQAGYQVRIITHAHFESFITPWGLEFAPITGDAVHLVENLMQVGNNAIRFLFAWRRFFAPHLDQIIQDVWDGCQGSDILIGTQLTAYLLHSVAEKMNLPFFRAPLWPIDRTACFPPTARVLPSTGTRANRLSHAAVDYGVHLLFRNFFNQQRRALHLPPYPIAPYPYNVLSGQPVSVLYGFSPLLIPKPPDWGEHIHVTGFWQMAAERDWQPPAALQDFLAAGPPPVFIGFGSSMTAQQFAPLLEITLTALKKSGQRGIILVGKNERVHPDWPDTVLPITSAPFAWLFPRTAAVVHQGGAGTLAWGLQAGIPMISVPFFGDQFMWAQRLSALGVSAATIPRPQLTAEKLAGVIGTAVTDDRLKQRAAAVGEQMRAEDGVANAIQMLQKHLR
ncbi:MAG TPA: glycosyltransferase [Phototrophicaceae bacterium]|nr:glycosyltransferase [Phototrophicaceae bacterium]